GESAERRDQIGVERGAVDAGDPDRAAEIGAPADPDDRFVDQRAHGSVAVGWGGPAGLVVGGRLGEIAEGDDVGGAFGLEIRSLAAGVLPPGEEDLQRTGAARGEDAVVARAADVVTRLAPEPEGVEEHEVTRPPV